MATVLADVDLLLTAASGDDASRIDEMSHWDGLLGLDFVAPWNLTGYPAMTVCKGLGPKELPLAAQIGG